MWSACARRLLDDTGDQVPEYPREQLAGAVRAVFGSWNTSRARTYREFHKIPHDLGTAVVVQSMVFGNISDDSGSGVVFTRDPATGEPGLFGEYLAHSQGEDVVAGTRTPDPVREALPSPVLTELERTAAALEREIGDVLDIEFTVEHSTLYLLQVRSAKRTPDTAVRIASDFLAEGEVPPRKVLRHVAVDHVRQAQRPGFDPAELEQARMNGRLLTAGIGACPGQVSGELVLDSDRAKQLAEAGHAVVLARPVREADLTRFVVVRGAAAAEAVAAVGEEGRDRGAFVGCHVAAEDVRETVGQAVVHQDPAQHLHRVGRHHRECAVPGQCAHDLGHARDQRRRVVLAQ